MSRGIGVAGVVSVLALVMLFSRWNAAERVTVDLGVWTLYRVPVIYVAFASLLLGMVVMLVAGLHSDLKIRRFLRERFEDESREEGQEFRDRYQRDLFLDRQEGEGGGAGMAPKRPSPPVEPVPPEPEEDESGLSPP